MDVLVIYPVLVYMSVLVIDDPVVLVSLTCHFGSL